jgi:hypothetical protein
MHKHMLGVLVSLAAAHDARANTPSVVNADLFYDYSRSTAEQAAIRAACGPNANTCFPTVVADLMLTASGFQNWTQGGDVDPAHHGQYWP